MTGSDDAIRLSDHRATTYDGASVAFFEPELRAPGRFADLLDVVPHARRLCVADMIVKERRAARFIGSQRSVLLPALSRSEGLLRGSISWDLEGRALDRYLLATLWDADGDGAARGGWEPPLRAAGTDLASDLGSIAFRSVPLEPGWTILPAREWRVIGRALPGRNP